MNYIDIIKKTLKDLSTVERIFHNERDFQLSLGFALNKYLGDSIRMEFPYPENLNSYADIMILEKGEPVFAVELKYLSKKGDLIINGEQFHFKRCSKTKREETIKNDIEKIEKFKNGCVLILSNDDRFMKTGKWEEYCNIKDEQGTYDGNFRYKIIDKSVPVL